MTVFVTQEARNRNFVPAMKWGEVVPIMPPEAQVVLTADPAVGKMKRILSNFSDDDYLLLSGDPVIMGIAVAVACEANMGRAKLLKWDKMDKSYYVVELDMNLREREKDGHTPRNRTGGLEGLG